MGIGRAHLNTKDEDGVTPLHLAVLQRHTDVVETLLAAKADANAVNADRTTALMSAAALQLADVVEQLLEASVDVNSTDSEGRRAVDLTACEHTKILLEKFEIRCLLDARYPPQEEIEEEPTDKEKPKKSKKKKSVTTTILGTYRVRLQNLPIDFTQDLLEDGIRKMMRTCGAPKPQIEIMTDPITNAPKGFAWVTFNDSEAAECALRGHGGELGGCILEVYAEEEVPS